EATTASPLGEGTPRTRPGMPTTKRFLGSSAEVRGAVFLDVGPLIGSKDAQAPRPAPLRVVMPSAGRPLAPPRAVARLIASAPRAAGGFKGDGPSLAPPDGPHPRADDVQ